MRPLSGYMLCAVLISLLLMPAGAPAETPQTMNYQVMLTDDADQPLADQSVQLVFLIYNVEHGGTKLWTETHNVVTNSIGVVSVVLGSTNPLAISFDEPLWLQVEVDSEVLSPRRELTSAPYALSGAGGGAGDGHSLDADDGSPVDALYVDSEGKVGVGTTSPDQQLHATSSLQVGSEGDNGYVRVHSGDAGGGGLYLTGEGTGGGGLNVYTPTRAQTIALGPTGYASGGSYLWLARNNTNAAGFSLVGNNNDTNEPWMGISGSARSVTFDMSEEGDNSVQLPDEAVSSTETSDEPGVASIQAAGYINLTLSNVTSVAARTMTEVPADGFVFVMATAQLTFVNTSTQAHTAKFGVSEFQNAWSAHTQETQIQMPGGLPAGQYHHHVAVSGLFAVSEGSNTFYLNAQELDGVCTVEARQLTLMYFPTSYGAVDTTD